MGPGLQWASLGCTGVALLALTSCNPDPCPGDIADECTAGQLGQVDYRDGDDGQNSGERGCMKMSEVLWTGSMSNDSVWHPADIFLEFRNECARPMDITNWLIELSGSDSAAWRIPGPAEGAEPRVLDVGEHAFLAASRDGCFPDADWVIPTFSLPYGDAFRLTLRDSDERLMEPIGSRTQPPFAGGYDLVSVRSMERIEIMFGGRGGEPQSWHYYTDADVDVPNNDRIATECRQFTLASPGRPNSPDYSGAFASGSFE